MKCWGDVPRTGNSAGNWRDEPTWHVHCLARRPRGLEQRGWGEEWWVMHSERGQVRPGCCSEGDGKASELASRGETWSDVPLVRFTLVAAWRIDLWVCLWKNGSQETSDEASIIIQAKDEHGLERCYQWMELNIGSILNIGPTRFTVGLDVGYEGRRRSYDASWDFGLSLTTPSHLRVFELALPSYLNIPLVNTHMAHSLSSCRSMLQHHSIKEAFSDHQL